MKEYQDYIPANARIVITYNKKPSVSFSYAKHYNFLKAYNYFLEPVLAMYLFTFISTIVISLTLVFAISRSIDLNIYLLSIGLWCFGSVTVYELFKFYLLKHQDWANKWIPEFGKFQSKFFSTTYNKVFRSKDVNKNNLIFIPIFNNTFLDYRATRNFSKYLKKVIIKEYPFRTKTRLFNLIKSDYYNEFIYYAVFEFDNKPTNGFLSVDFA